MRIEIPEKPLSFNQAYSITCGPKGNNSGSGGGTQSQQQTYHADNIDSFGEFVRGKTSGNKSSGGCGKAPYLYKTQMMENYEQAVGLHVQQSLDTPLTGPLALAITFYFTSEHQSNEDLSGLPYPDVDGPIKSLLDALEGILFEDDTQIQACTVSKEIDKENPRTILQVRRPDGSLFNQDSD